MFKEMIFLETASISSSGAIGNLLTKLAEAGFFSYLIPFLLIFALVFGILVKVKIFKENKMVNGIIALSVALMSLQFDFVPTFFSQIFPRLGIGLAIVLVVLILAGLFIDPDNKAINYVLLGIAAVIVGAVIIQSAGAVGWQSGEWWSNNWEVIMGSIVLVVIVALVVAGSGNKNQTPKGYAPFYARQDP
jgi:hypothetical protein